MTSDIYSQMIRGEVCVCVFEEKNTVIVILEIIRLKVWGGAPGWVGH